MTRSTTSFFPDINVWVALTSARHVHHQVAHDFWDDAPTQARFFFCRYTQIGLLRLLSMKAVMGRDTMNQSQAWTTYDAWFEDSRVEFAEEPHGVEPFFRALTRLRHPSPKAWPDAYLAAFADAAGLTLVTFDRALRGKAKSALLLAG